MKANYITLGIRNKGTKGYEFGGIAGAVNIEGKCVSSRAIGLGGVYSDKQAYEIVDEWCKAQEKEKGVPYNQVSFKEIMLRINKVRSDKKPQKSKGGSISNISIKDKFAPLLLYPSNFHPRLKSYIDSIGYAKVKQALVEGLAYVEEIGQEAKRIEEEQAANKKLTAEKLLEAYQATGFDMSSSISDPVIKALYTEMVADYVQSKP